MAKDKETPKGKDGTVASQTLKAASSKGKAADNTKPKAKASADKALPKTKAKKNKIKPADAPAKALVWEAFACQFKPGKKAQDGFRAKVPGGWFVSVSHNKGGGSFFYSDPTHSWKGYTV